jgi:hypothetical protein
LALSVTENQKNGGKSGSFTAVAPTSHSPQKKGKGISAASLRAVCRRGDAMDIIPATRVESVATLLSEGHKLHAFTKNKITMIIMFIRVL